MQRVQRLRGLGLVAATVALLVAVTPAAVRAQDPRPPANATLTGEVTDVNPLTIKVNDQEYLLQTGPAVVVNREGHEVKLGELTKGDNVTFTTGPDASVQRIDVTDAATDERTWLLLALLVVAAIAAVVLVWYLTQRRRRSPTVGHDRGRPVSSHR